MGTQQSMSDPCRYKAAHHGIVTREKQTVPCILLHDVGSIFSVWSCQGSEKRSILVEQRIKFKNHTNLDAEKIHV